MSRMRDSKGRFLASGSAVLSVNADPFASGLNRSTRDLEAWGKKTAGTLGGMALSLPSAIGVGMAAGFGSSMTSTITSSLREIPRMALGALDDLAKQGGMAKALGLNSEQFTGIAGVAKSVGEDTREFVESLVTMGKLGSDAFKGIGEVAGPAFKALNLDAAQFVSMRADQQFFSMFEALSKVTDGLTRTRLIMAAFGEDGGKWLLPLLAKTPAELRKMADGFSVSGASMRQAEAASLAWKKTTQSMTVAIRDAAIVAAPSFTDALGGLTRAVSGSKDSFATLGIATGELLKDFIIPGATHIVEFGAGFIKASKALSDMDTAMNKLNKTAEEGNKDGGFWSKFPQTGQEFGKSVATAISMQEDAWRSMRSHGDWLREYLHRMKRPTWSPSDNAYERTEKGLDEANKPNAPAPTKVYGGLLNTIAGTAKIHSAIMEVSKRAWENLSWKYMWLDPKRYQEHTLESTFGKSGLGGLVKGWGGMGLNFLGGLGGLMGHWQTDPRKGAGAWAGLGAGGVAVPRFATAIEQGSKEAYSLEMAAKYGRLGDREDTPKKQLNQAVIANRKLDGVKQAIDRLTDKLEIV